jgi:hypothetical protein
MFKDHRFERLLANYNNGLITLDQYLKSYSYLLEVKLWS